MESEGNRDSGNDSPAEQKGIFSSPELSVNSENLEEIKPELSDENKSRIASAFAQTDATQKHDQLSEQMAEQDAVSGIVIPAGGIGNNSTASTATGDIRIPGAKKKSKLPLVLAAVALIAVVGGVVAWLALGRGSGLTQKEMVIAAFNDYKTYLQEGPEGLRSKDEDENSETEGTWFVLNLQNMHLPVETQKSYVDEILKRYTTFSNAFADDVQTENTRNIISNYTLLLNSTIKLSALDIVSNELLKVYLEGGAEEAYKFIETTTTSDSELTLITSAMSSLAKYLEAQLTIIEIYGAHSCITDGALDHSCEEALSSVSPTYDSMLRNQDTMLRILNQSLRSLGASLETGTEQLKNLVEESHE